MRHVAAYAVKCFLKACRRHFCSLLKSNFVGERAIQWNPRVKTQEVLTRFNIFYVVNQGSNSLMLLEQNYKLFMHVTGRKTHTHVFIKMHFEILLYDYVVSMTIYKLIFYHKMLREAETNKLWWWYDIFIFNSWPAQFSFKWCSRFQIIHLCSTKLCSSFVPLQSELG